MSYGKIKRGVRWTGREGYGVILELEAWFKASPLAISCGI
jgi:hypothetical protein